MPAILTLQHAARTQASPAPSPRISRHPPFRVHAHAACSIARSCWHLKRRAAWVRAAAATPAAAEAESVGGEGVSEAEGAGGEEEEEEEFFELPLPQHLRVQDAFTPLAAQLRQHFDSRVGEPLRTRSDRFVWDYWFVPGQYSLLRTPAEHFFPPELYDQLEDALIAFGERELGCRGISPVWLSYYIHGCRQELHSDSPHGPWAFVLSLTHWEGRAFTGGETMILQPQVLDYWRSFEPTLGTETPQLVTKVEPHFNRLTVFDPRFPHGVSLVEGTMDPQKSRVVLHGWFTQPTPFIEGGLSEEEATPGLNAALDAAYAALADAPPAVGTLVVRAEVSGADGRVVDLHWLTHTLVSRPQGGGDPEESVAEVLGRVAEALLAARFPPSADGRATHITVPFVFE